MPLPEITNFSDDQIVNKIAGQLVLRPDHVRRVLEMSGYFALREELDLPPQDKPREGAEGDDGQDRAESPPSAPQEVTEPVPSDSS